MCVNGALHRIQILCRRYTFWIWCGVNRLGDSGVKVVWIYSAILQLLLSRRVSYCLPGGVRPECIPSAWYLNSIQCPFNIHVQALQNNMADFLEPAVFALITRGVVQLSSKFITWNGNMTVLPSRLFVAHSAIIIIIINNNNALFQAHMAHRKTCIYNSTLTPTCASGLCRR